MLNINSSMLTLAGLGISVLLLGGAIGNTIARRQQVKEEIKAIQDQHRTVLEQIEVSRRKALENEQRALSQIDSVYQILDVLAVREGRARGEIQDARNTLGRLRLKAADTKTQLVKQAGESVISFDNQ